jgi:hypothetical protein
MSTFGPDPVPTFFANEQYRRFVHLAFADHHRAVDRKPAQFAAHGIDGGLI